MHRFKKNIEEKKVVTYKNQKVRIKVSNFLIINHININISSMVTY
jgi:hypothetical protein